MHPGFILWDHVSSRQTLAEIEPEENLPFFCNAPNVTYISPFI